MKRTIQRVDDAMAHQVLAIYHACISEMATHGIFQWDERYPNIETIRSDIKKQWLYACILTDHPVAVMTIQEEPEPAYESVRWQDRDGQHVVIHRLAVHPDYHQRGIAKQLMQFAEDYARTLGCTSIRLDTYSQNHIAAAFYRKYYTYTGDTYYTKRPLPCHCFEKILQ